MYAFIRSLHRQFQRNNNIAYHCHHQRNALLRDAIFVDLVLWFRYDFFRGDMPDLLLGWRWADGSGGIRFGVFICCILCCRTSPVLTMNNCLPAALSFQLSFLITKTSQGLFRSNRGSLVANRDRICRTVSQARRIISSFRQPIFDETYRD